MGHQTLVPAEVTQEAGVVQVHDSVLLPSDVDVHGQPVVRKVALKRPKGGGVFKSDCCFINTDLKL